MHSKRNSKVSQQELREWLDTNLKNAPNCQELISDKKIYRCENCGVLMEFETKDNKYISSYTITCPQCGHKNCNVGTFHCYTS